MTSKKSLATILIKQWDEIHHRRDTGHTLKDVFLWLEETHGFTRNYNTWRISYNRVKAKMAAGELAPARVSAVAVEAAQPSESMQLAKPQLKAPPSPQQRTRWQADSSKRKNPLLEELEAEGKLKRKPKE
jgi:hypothetical protein